MFLDVKRVNLKVTGETFMGNFIIYIVHQSIITGLQLRKRTSATCRAIGGTRCRVECYIKLELGEIGRRGLLDTSGSGRAALVDRHEYVDERTVSIKGRELLEILQSS
jgi:hypothetical protein